MTHPLQCLFFRPAGTGQQQERLFQSRTDHFEIAQLNSVLGEGRQDSLRVLGKHFKFVPSELESLRSDQGIELLKRHVWGTEADSLPANLALDLLRRAVGDHLSQVDEDDAPGQGIGFFQVVSGQNDRFPVRDLVIDLLPEDETRLDIEPGGKDPGPTSTTWCLFLPFPLIKVQT